MLSSFSYLVFRLLNLSPLVLHPQLKSNILSDKLILGWSSLVAYYTYKYTYKFYSALAVLVPLQS